LVRLEELETVERRERVFRAVLAERGLPRFAELFDLLRVSRHRNARVDRNASFPPLSMTSPCAMIMRSKSCSRMRSAQMRAARLSRYAKRMRRFQPGFFQIPPAFR